MVSCVARVGRFVVAAPIVIGAIACRPEPTPPATLDLSRLVDAGSGPRDFTFPPTDDLVSALPDLSAVDRSQPAASDLAMPNFDLASSSDLAKSAGDLSTGNCHVMINEVQTGGTSSASDEFVELYNACSAAVDLTGFTLVYRSAAGTTDITEATLSGVLGGQKYFVLGGSAFTGTPNMSLGGGGLAEAGGGLQLRNGGTAVDGVAWGTATNAFKETAVAPPPSAGKSIERLPNGVDTDNNSADFAVGASPTPGAVNQ